MTATRMAFVQLLHGVTCKLAVKFKIMNTYGFNMNITKRCLITLQICWYFSQSARP